MPGAKLPILTITNRLYFRDDGLYIYSSTNGQLDIVADSTINLNGNTTLTTGKTLTITSGAVNLGTAALTLGGDVTLAGNASLEFSTGAESIRLPNDGVLASGNKYAQYAGVGGSWWTVPLASGAVCGWLRVKVASGSVWHTLYTPLFSSNAW